MRLLITSIIMLCITAYTHGTKIIIVHGSFATNEPWYQPGGDFFEAVNKQARTYNFAIESFAWSGIPTKQSILAGAKNLAQRINSNLDEQHILIGHSHGGNVILLASQLLETAPAAAMPFLVSASTEPVKRKLTLKKPLDEYKKTIQFFSQALFSWEPLRWLFENDPIKKPLQPPMAHVFLLGTPINSWLFSPALHQIGTVWNLYSHADTIQTLGGSCKKKFPQTKGIHNFEIKLTTTGSLAYSPKHCDMHHPSIGSWLIHLAELLNPATITPQELFFGYETAPVHFTNNYIYKALFDKLN